MRMREAALTKVLIIDERIWNSYRNQGDHKLTHQRLHKKNIYLISLEAAKVDAEEKTEKLYFIDILGNQIGELKRSGDMEIYEDYKEVYLNNHFVSLHQGLFDRMQSFCNDALNQKAPDDSNKSERMFHHFFRKGCFDELVKPLRYIIHSGRSKTPFLPSGVAFIQLSALDGALSDCKYTLIELLYSSILEFDNP